VEIVGHPLFCSSTILADHHKEGQALLGFLPPHQKLKLLYRASRDGWTASTFHQLCDNQGPTVTLVRRSDNGTTIFGGYTSVSWDSSNRYKHDHHAFLFSLMNTAALGPVKLDVVDTANSIYCHMTYGPSFGGGHDLHIHDNGIFNISSYSNLGHSYSVPASQQGKSLLAGSYQFTPSEVEVYAVM